MRKTIGDGDPINLAERYKRLLSLEFEISYVRGRHDRRR
jgi:hypothetical protein